MNDDSFVLTAHNAVISFLYVFCLSTSVELFLIMSYCIYHDHDIVLCKVLSQVVNIQHLSTLLSVLVGVAGQCWSEY